MKVSKFIGIYDGMMNASPHMTCPELFASQIQWPKKKDLVNRRAGTGRVIYILEMVYENDLLVSAKLHPN